jgi:uncharacterized phage-associated protein
MGNKVSVFDVASYISNLLEVDQLKLQKLLFYTQAVSLVRFNKQAFSETIEAWEYGPVVPEVYFKVKKYDVPIKIKRVSDDPIDPDIIKAADMVIKYYGGKSGVALIAETHSEKPWINAYKKGRNSEITPRAIKTYYKNIYSFDTNE